MKTIKKRFAPVIFVICVLLSVVCCRPACATVSSSDYLDWYRAYLTANSGGEISVSVNVEACGDMKQVGASKIVLYESSDGELFSRVDTFKYEDYPAMMGSGWDHYAVVLTYDGTPGYAYYAIVYCYAGNSTGHDEKTYTTAVIYARK